MVGSMVHDRFLPLHGQDRSGAEPLPAVTWRRNERRRRTRTGARKDRTSGSGRSSRRRGTAGGAPPAPVHLRDPLGPATAGRLQPMAARPGLRGRPAPPLRRGRGWDDGPCGGSWARSRWHAASPVRSGSGCSLRPGGPPGSPPRAVRPAEGRRLRNRPARARREVWPVWASAGPRARRSTNLSNVPAARWSAP
jgi:hypothetical protein